MNVAPSRDPERYKAVWVLPRGLRPNEALQHFERHVKPRPYTFEHWVYNPRNGQFSTWS